MDIKHALKKLLRMAGYDVNRYTPTSHPLARRKQIFTSYEIDTIFDVGANTGQFAKQMREGIGFSGHILSFEPLSTAFKTLQKNAENDPRWQVFNYALGDVEEKQVINIAGNSQSSSLLSMLPSHLKSAPDSKYVGKETIKIKTLDSVFNHLCIESKNIYLKIDTQGFESKVLRGAGQVLDKIDTVQMEMSLVPLYEGELLAHEMISIMHKKGYAIIDIERGFSDPTTSQLLQVDGIFHRF